jgi:hypothetical protein
MGFAASARNAFIGAAATVAAAMPFSHADAQLRTAPTTARPAATAPVSTRTPVRNNFIEFDQRQASFDEAYKTAILAAKKDFVVVLVQNNPNVISAAREVLTEVYQSGRTRVILMLASENLDVTPERRDAVLLITKTTLSQIGNIRNAGIARFKDELKREVKSDYDKEVVPVVIAASRQGPDAQP